jgi:hypothetical protein
VRYIVPQKASLANLKSGDKFFFRVDNIYRNCRVAMKVGEKTIYSKKKARVAPSEMESIEIDEKMLGELRQIYNTKDTKDTKKLVICLEK